MRQHNEVVDPTGERQLQRRRVLARFVAPFLVVGTLIAAILGITLHSYNVNRNGALTLSRQVLAALQSYVAEEVFAYLEPAASTVSIVNDLLSHTDEAVRPVAFASYAASMLRQVPQIEAFTLANGRGDVAIVSRLPDGGTETRRILVSATGRTATIEKRDAGGHRTSLVPDPGADFDPRPKAWFKGAVANHGARFWSRPYLLPLTGKPVLTVSAARSGEGEGKGNEKGKGKGEETGELTRVASVDVALDQLSRFTSSLKIGGNGRAVILDAAGHLVASPDLLHPGADPSKAGLDPSRDPVLFQAWNRERVLGGGARLITSNGTRFVTIAGPVPGAAPGWVLLLAAPESDFAGFAVIGGRQDLLFSLVLVLLACLLAGLLARQGLRADRAGRLLAITRDRAREESAALGALVREQALFDPASEAPQLTERLADMADAGRASIWRIADGGRNLACEDSFDTTEGGHTGGFALSHAELPRFFEFLETGETAEIADAARDPRTAELSRLAARQSRALVVVPIEGEDAVAGAVILEDAKSFGRARNFARAVAGIAAIRIRAVGDAGIPSPDAAIVAAPRSIEDDQARTRLSDLGSHDRTADLEGLAVYPAASVMVLTFADPHVTSRRDAGNILEAADGMARAVQEAGRRFDLPYLKLVGHTLIAACGCAPDADGTDAAIRLADAALAIRETCLAVMERTDLDAFFRIGLDVGRVVGRALGDDPPVFNLWGDALRMAELMAETAPDAGTIQVTEAAYLHLRQQFLFRQRGRFFMPRVGVARCFILAGRR
jgi:class 3 adenylate cyclase